MASLNNDFSFNGRVGNLSSYKMRGSKKNILRSPGGPSKETIQTDPSCIALHNNSLEWKGVTQTTKALRQAIFRIDHLRDYNYTGTLNKLLKAIQKIHPEGDHGKKPVLLSQYKYLLEGFDLNETNKLDAVIRTPIPCQINRDTLTATVEIPELIHGFNFRNFTQLSFYRLVFTTGTVSDFSFDEEFGLYRPLDKNDLNGNTVITDWLPVESERPAETLLIEPMFTPVPAPNSTFILSGGVEFGAPDAWGNIRFKKYSGSGKLLKLG